MTGRPSRLWTFSYVGLHRYSLTFCVYKRRHVFTNGEVVAATLGQISHTARNRAFAILAYCFMPDHLHLLVEAKAESANLVKFAHAVKQRTGHEHRRRSTAPLWQKGYFEHVLRDDELAPVVAKYILANPVRAGLCTEPRDYPFSGSLVWSKEELNDLWFGTV